MSVEEDGLDPRVRALRAAGEDRAADILEALAEGCQQQRQEQEQAQEPQPKVGPPGIPLVSDDPAQRQADAEGRIVAERLMKSGIGQDWVRGGSLLDDGRPNR